jgi:hypothetical protein
MRGLDPRIQDFMASQLALDGRVKPGHEGVLCFRLRPERQNLTF